MHLSSFAVGLLLPLLAIAQSDSSTLTLTSTLRSTHTVTVSQVVASVTSTFPASSSTTSSSSSISSSTSIFSSTTVSTSSSSSSSSATSSTSSFNSTLVASPTAILATASSVYKIPTTGTGSPRVSGTGAPVATSSISDNFIGAASNLNGMYAGGVGVVVMIAAAML